MLKKRKRKKKKEKKRRKKSGPYGETYCVLQPSGVKGASEQRDTLVRIM